MICEENNFILKSIAKPYFNLEYIKFFYLLQKVIKLNTSKKLYLLIKAYIINYNEQ